MTKVLKDVLSIKAAMARPYEPGVEAGELVFERLSTDGTSCIRVSVFLNGGKILFTDIPAQDLSKCIAFLA